MSSTYSASARLRSPDALRWAACFLVVVGAHAGAAAALFSHWRGQVELVAEAPAILVDLAPVAVAPAAPPVDLAPGPPQEQSPAEPAPPAAKAESAIPAAEPLENIVTMSLPPPPKIAPQDVVLPPRKPVESENASRPQHRRTRLASAPSSTERKAARAAAPEPGAASHDPNALPNWKSALVARLEHYKRYPGEAQARGEQGVAQLAFSVDRSGGVHNARILRSSGSDLLDRATLSLIERAQPLPAPPPEIRGTQISIVVPIRYNMR